MDWKEQFAPLGWGLREGQEVLGNAIIQTISQRGRLTAQASTGTGKSLAILIPIIHAIKNAPEGRSPRAVISVETIALQNQFDKKDLPLLYKVYGGFSYKKLMGRSNYFCLSHAKEESKGDGILFKMVSTLESRLESLGAGEKSDIENVLGVTIGREVWSRISGNTDYCPNNDCNSESCFSAKAREEALAADIVVVNNKILAIDHDMKSSNMGGMASDGMVGDYDILAVDEAHSLEGTLSDHWTERYNDWEINDHTGRVQKALEAGYAYDNSRDYRDQYFEASAAILSFLDLTKKFFAEIESRRDRKWKGSENPFCMQFISGPSEYLRSLMLEFETTGPAVFSTLRELTERVYKYLVKTLEIMMDAKSGKVGKELKKQVRKGITSCRWLLNACYLMDKAMNSKDGIISHGGMTWGSVIEGWERKTGEHGMTIRIVPIDLSARSTEIWSRAKSTIFMSATLEDLTTGDFKYFKRSLGVGETRDVRVESPFAKEQQLVYLTSKEYPSEEGTVFSVEEIVKSVNATNGRSLILFTSRRDLEMTEQALLQYKIAGQFPYPMLVQSSDADKVKLAQQFKDDESSVLLGLKSFTTGVDIPGSSLSNVILARFPLSRFSAECKMKIKYWRTQKFPNWYDRDSLTVFQQSMGRLIRSDECIGVVSILDQRAFETGSSVLKLTQTGVSAVGSKYTFSLDEVTNHIEGGVVAVH